MDSLDFESKCAIAKLAMWAFTILCAWGWVDHLAREIRALAHVLKDEAYANRRQLGELTRPQKKTPPRAWDGPVLDDENLAPIQKATELLGKVRRQ